MFQSVLRRPSTLGALPAAGMQSIVAWPLRTNLRAQSALQGLFFLRLLDAGRAMVPIELCF
jgi:hypothetical protein